MWPFAKRVAKREAAPFTDAVVAALVAHAGGAQQGVATRTAALETCAGLWARALARATVDNDLALLTPPTLALVGRELCRRGEAVLVLEVRDGVPMLFAAASWDVRGGYDASTWRYRIDLFGATRHATRLVPGDSVLHFKYVTDPGNPWQGLSPLSFAATTGSVVGNVEQRVADELGGPSGYVLPVPGVSDSGTDDEDDDALAPLKAQLKAMRGSTTLVETTAAAWGEGNAEAPRADWKPQRVGANPPDVLAQLRTDAANSVYSACGVPPSLFDTTSATAVREGWRLFVQSTIAPVASLVAHEASRKLERNVTVDVDRLIGVDQRARVFGTLARVEGVSAQHAARIAAIDLNG